MSFEVYLLDKKGKELKREMYKGWEIRFIQTKKGLVKAFGYNGGYRQNMHPSYEVTDSSKTSTFDEMKEHIRKHEREMDAKPEPYYQYKRNFWSG